LITVPRSLVVLAWLTLVLQFALCIQAPLFRGEGIWPGVGHYVGFFTILTNGLCALVMTAHVHPGWRGRFAAFLRRPGVATSAAASIFIVATVYHLVLRTTWMPDGLYLFTDLMLHTLLPMAYLAFWWASVPRGALAMRDIPRWLSWPGLYTVYAFARGELTGMYPYFFVDVPTIGYLAAVRNTLMILTAFAVVCAGLVGINRFAGQRMRLEA
jgi:hypothetical protein